MVKLRFFVSAKDLNLTEVEIDECTKEILDGNLSIKEKIEKYNKLIKELFCLKNNVEWFKAEYGTFPEEESVLFSRLSEKADDCKLHVRKVVVQNLNITSTDDLLKFLIKYWIEYGTSVHENRKINDISDISVNEVVKQALVAHRNEVHFSLDSRHLPFGNLLETKKKNMKQFLYSLNKNTEESLQTILDRLANR
jgi:hypothetical protein